MQQMTEIAQLIAELEQISDENDGRLCETCRNAAMVIRSLQAEARRLSREIQELREESVNIAPVKHGRWKTRTGIKSVKRVHIPEFECSICGMNFCDIINNPQIYQFCPSCGARMDLEE